MDLVERGKLKSILEHSSTSRSRNQRLSYCLKDNLLGMESVANRSSSLPEDPGLQVAFSKWRHEIEDILEACPGTSLIKIVRNGRTYFGLKIQDRKAPLIMVNMNPSKAMAGDCTTRALTYALQTTGENITYSQIRQRQRELADEIALCARPGKGWNFNGVYERQLWARGWITVKLQRPMTRTSFARMISFMHDPVLVHSRGHVSIIHRGMIVDSWDSRMGRVDAVTMKCSPEEFLKFTNLFFSNGYSYYTRWMQYNNDTGIVRSSWINNHEHRQPRSGSTLRNFIAELNMNSQEYAMLQSGRN